MAPLAVDPATLDGAGVSLTDVGQGIGTTLSRLEGTLSVCGGMCGDDPVGAAMGESYDSAADGLLKAFAAARNGMVNLGDGVRMSAHNYSMAEALSDGRGRAEPLPVPAASGAICAGAPPTSVGGGIPAPPGFGWVSKYIGMIWPTADSAQLRGAAGSWIAAGTDLLVTQTAAAPALGVIGAQQIPEAEAMGQAFADSLNAAAQLMSHATSIAGQLNSYADKVDEVHAAIIDLLARICDPLTGAKVIWDFLTDEEESEIKEIAEDIKTVVEHFATQVTALAAQLAPLATGAGDIATAMLKLADKEWEQFLQGNPVGQLIDVMAQITKGFALQGWDLVESVGWTYNPQRAFVDPQGSYNDYRNLVTGMAPLVGADADGLTGTGDAWLTVGKETLHWDLWGTNPAEAFGRSVFDVATFFVPGGALTKLGTVGHGVAETAESVARAAPHLPEAPRAPDAPRVPDPPKAPELPPAAEPGSLEPPKASRGGAPVSPTAPGSGGALAPGGSPSHHGPTSSGPPAGAPAAADDGRPSSGPVSSPAPAAAGDGAPPPGSSPPAPAAADDAGRLPSGPSFSPSPGVGAGDGGLPPSGVPASAAPSAPAGSPGGLSSSGFDDEISATAEVPDDGKPGAGTGASSQGVGAETDSSPTGKSDKDLVPVGAGGNDFSASGGSTGDAPPPSGPHGIDGGTGSGGSGGHDGTEAPTDVGLPNAANGDPAGTPLDIPKVAGLDYPMSPTQVVDVLQTPGAELARLAEGGVPAHVLEGYDPLAGKTVEEFVAQVTTPGPDGAPRWDWDNQAPNNGFAGVPTESTRIPTDVHLDRIGPNGGAFMSPEGEPLAHRATPPGLAAQYHTFEGTGREVPDGWVVKYGDVKDAFGQPGTAQQWVVEDRATGRPIPVELLLRSRIIRETKLGS